MCCCDVHAPYGGRRAQIIRLVQEAPPHLRQRLASCRTWWLSPLPVRALLVTADKRASAGSIWPARLMRRCELLARCPAGFSFDFLTVRRARIALGDASTRTQKTHLELME